MLETLWLCTVVFILPIVIGILTGYFLSIWVVLAVTAFVVYNVYRFIKPNRNFHGTSGHLGMAMMATPFLILLLLSMWITWFFAPGGVGWEVDLKPTLEFLRKLFLK